MREKLQKGDGGSGGRPFEPKPQVEVDSELAFHLEERVRDYVARGMDPVAAITTSARCAFRFEAGVPSGRLTGTARSG